MTVHAASHSRWSRRATSVGVVLAVALLVACSSDSSADTPAETPTTDVATRTAPEPSDRPVAAASLVSHLFIAVGESRALDAYGERLEVLHLSDPPAVTVEGDRLTADHGGISCLRFRYRSELADENSIQTGCVVVFDETGSCAGLEPLHLDLLAHLDGSAADRGEADLLASGTGRFYAACRTDTGAYRLQQPSEALPPPYLHVVDALGSGPYSLGIEEMADLRAGAISSFSGARIETPWIITVSREITSIELTVDGAITEAEDCNSVPSCSPASDAVQAGDILRLSIGLDLQLVGTLAATTEASILDEYTSDRIGARWSEIATLSPDVRDTVLLRLLSMDIMDDVVEQFASLYELREKQVIVAYAPFWAVRNVMALCRPDEMSQCDRVEAALASAEQRHTGRLRESGLELWLGAPLDYGPDGAYTSVAENVRPHLGLFDGVLGWLAGNQALGQPRANEVLIEAVHGFATELRSEQRVVLMIPGPPITAVTGGAFCEADVCPSDFTPAYAHTEAWLGAAIDSMPPNQFVGFGLALFDGAHFDLRQPLERYEFFSLNRVGETGYNHPAVNIYRAQ